MTLLPERIEMLVFDIIALGTDHCNDKPAPQNETEAVAQINLLLVEVIDEVVGQDETSEDEVENDLYYATRNGLRKEIKQRAKDMLGEK